MIGARQLDRAEAERKAAIHLRRDRRTAVLIIASVGALGTMWQMFGGTVTALLRRAFH